MKGWLKTGLLAVAVYVVVFLFNKFFLSAIPDNMVYRIVNAPVYFLLQLFGVVDAGIVFFVGVFAYFLLGALVFFVAKCIDDISKKFGILKEDLGSEVTRKSMGVDKK